MCLGLSRQPYPDLRRLVLDVLDVLIGFWNGFCYLTVHFPTPCTVLSCEGTIVGWWCVGWEYFVRLPWWLLVSLLARLGCVLGCVLPGGAGTRCSWILGGSILALATSSLLIGFSGGGA